jgi:predicted nucleotidyltransferase
MRDGSHLPVDVAAVLARTLEEGARADVVSAYLFGSRARGQPHRQSDVDVGVLLRRDRLPTQRDQFEARLGLIALLASALRGPEVDVVILNDAPPALASRIVSEGRRVFCGDDVADHTFIRDVQLRAADLIPFLRRTRQVKLAAIRR